VTDGTVWDGSTGGADVLEGTPNGLDQSHFRAMRTDCSGRMKIVTVWDASTGEV